MNNEKRRLMFEWFAENNPKPTTELNYRSNFELLIAVLLSAQSTDVGVNKVTKVLFAKADNAQAMLDLGEDEVRDIISSLGLYNSKAKHAMQACQMLVERHNGVVPDNRKDLEALPGVGRKTANVVLNTAFGQPTMAVDTHIFRVSNRTGLAPGKNVRQVEDNLLKKVPKDYLVDAHHWLILHGRYVCKARKPMCYQCGIAGLCDFKEKTPEP